MQSELANLIEAHTGSDGMHETAIPSLFLYRGTEPSEIMHVIQEPSLCLMAQGQKVITLGNTAYTYDSEHFLLVSVGLPLTGQVTQATPENPYLSIRLDLDATAISTLVMESNLNVVQSHDPLALHVGKLEVDLRDAVIRLLRLLNTPERIPALSPLIIREILYLLLVGSEGGRLAGIALSNGQVHRVAAAIDLLRREFKRSLRIEEIAREVGMSPSGLHHQFRAVTALSPLQFQKHIRLQEARRLMLGESLDAASASFEVGYESPSQFSREYRRHFGLPPARDVAQLRQATQVTA